MLHRGEVNYTLSIEEEELRERHFRQNKHCEHKEKNMY